jgi:hypothetical protein
MSEPVVLAKVTCHADGTTFNLRWDDDTIRPVLCPVCGGPTVTRLRQNGTWVDVSFDQGASEADPEPEPEPEEQPQP